MGCSVTGIGESTSCRRVTSSCVGVGTAAAALKEHGPRFALAGSYALWVFGAPEPVHDVDFVVAEADTETAANTLSKAGFEIERTPEDWLFKART